MHKKIKLSTLQLDKSFWERFGYDQDAIDRYVDLYKSRKTKTLVVQKGTNKIIDGLHRYEAATKAGVGEVYVDERDIPDSELRAEAYKLNAAHGVPYNKEERNNLIKDLYIKDGKTEEQIAKIVGLAQSAISGIVGNIKTDKTDKRRKLTNEEIIAIRRLLLTGEIQEDVAKKFGVGRTTITDLWAKTRDGVKDSYESGKMKEEVAEEYGLTDDEIDQILQEYGDPINFTPLTASFWPGFGLDRKYGKKHPGNIPAGLVQNLLFYYSKPGDLILDVFAGGGVVQDVCDDMVNRKCESFDILPQRKDIKKHDIWDNPPELDEEPSIIFLDPPYGPQKEGEYTDEEHDLSNLSVDQFLNRMEEIFGYWEKGTLILLMGAMRKEGEFTDLPVECEARMKKQGWEIIDRIVNEIANPEGDSGFGAQQLLKALQLLRGHIDIIIGKK